MTLQYMRSPVWPQNFTEAAAVVNARLAGLPLCNLQGIRRACRRYLYRYDFGIDCSRGGRRRCNQEVYGQHDPPPYDLATINTPIALFTGV